MKQFQFEWYLHSRSQTPLCFVTVRVSHVSRHLVATVSEKRRCTPAGSTRLRAHPVPELRSQKQSDQSRKNADVACFRHQKPPIWIDILLPVEKRTANKLDHERAQ